MRKILSFFLAAVLLSCSDYVDRPKNLLSQKQMAEVIAELTVHEEILRNSPKSNMENGTRYVLKKQEISATVFADSYKYYATSRKLDGILTEAQRLIKDRHPEAATYIEKELKKNAPEILPEK